ncbi:hypothetical protein UG55_102259 [Frankia sp. EI5c]|uniref:hypothetical protein n=1 Tax=Frankia sp. EI5c TaxID=683316 RepID=UPI0007C2B933|nr:hypothetical protein [Frankia sp. EI5c]OAA25399.1 hypothetical protein UG55_102259 [Frankia sp. EI5c]
MRVDLRRVAAARRPSPGQDSADKGALAVPEQTGGGASAARTGRPPDSPPTSGVPRAAPSRDDPEAAPWHRPEAVSAPGYAVSRAGEVPRPVDRPVDRPGPVDRTRHPADAFDERLPDSPAEDGQPASTDPRAAAVPPRRRDAGLLVLAGGAAAVASFLPWSTLSSGDETRTFTGMTVGDGRLTLVAGLTLLAVGVIWLRGGARPGNWWPGGGVPAGASTARLAALLLTVVSGLDLALGPATLSSFRGISADVFEVRPQVGVGVVLVAGLVALFAATRGAGRRSRRH